MSITRWEFLRFAIVGVFSNIVLYLAYLWLTTLGMGHKSAMSLLYALGVAQTFLFNKRWTFRHDAATHTALLRYIMLYAFGYLFNLLMLMLLVDRTGFPHQWVQGGMILLLAVVLFCGQKYWVFHTPKNTAP